MIVERIRHGSAGPVERAGSKADREAVTAPNKEGANGLPQHDDPSLWRLRSGADGQLDDRCASDKGDGDPGRSDFPTT